jgi:hypothetical protein
VRAYAKEYPGRYSLTVQAPRSDDLEMVALSDDLISVIAAVLRLYNLSDENMIHAIRSIRSIVQGFVTLEAAGGFAMPVSLDRSFHWLVDLFITGLETASRADSPGASNT